MSSRSDRRALGLALLALLAGCGDLPQPFRGRPGATAQRLAAPPPARLAVVTPTTALLSDEAGRSYALAVADALAARDVPAVAEQAKPGDWRLLTTAELNGQQVVPHFAVQDPQGAEKGATAAAGVPASAWAEASVATLKQSAEAAAPKISELLTSIEASRRQSDPTSLINRPARVWLKPVTGAPGDGNRSLTAQMRDQLGKLGITVQDTIDGADFSLAGTVDMGPLPGKQQKVEITWVVNDSRGERGKVAQLNAVPQGTLDKYWGEVAMVVAEQAAGGVRDVITRAATLK